MYTLVEDLLVLSAAFVLTGFFLGLAIALISIKDLAIRLGKSPVGIAFTKPFSLNRWWPAGSGARPIKFDNLEPVPIQYPEVHMKNKWFNLSSPTRDDQVQVQQSDAGGKGPEVALHPPDSEPVLPVVADIRPSGATLLDAYRQHAIKRSAGEYNINKVAEMLQSEHIRTLPRQAKRAAILLALQAAGVKLQDVLEDAIQQNEALDNAEHAREAALGEFETRKEQLNHKLQVMMESLVTEYDALIQHNKEEVSAERDKFAEWRLAKIQEEQKIADAVSYLIDENATSD